jgi:hypothetical protein
LDIERSWLDRIGSEGITGPNKWRRAYHHYAREAICETARRFILCLGVLSRLVSQRYCPATGRRRFCELDQPHGATVENVTVSIGGTVGYAMASNCGFGSTRVSLGPVSLTVIKETVAFAAGSTLIVLLR